MNAADITNIIFESLKVSFSYLISPGKRVFVLYLFTSLLFAYFIYKKSGISVPFLSYVFNKKVWIGKSPLVDYSFIFFNSLIKVLVIAPFLVYSLFFSEYINDFLVQYYGPCEWSWSERTFIILYTVLIIVINDLASYIVHYLMHRVPFLWEFHKVHHSATVLNPFTQYRIHPIELIINNFRGILIKGVVTGIFLYFSNGKVSLLTFLGINVLNFIFLFLGANLRHSHVKLKYFNFLEYIFISPYQHQIHHSDSVKHYNTNMGSRLAIWDYLFGTLIRSEEVKRIRFGLGEETKHYNSFVKNLFSPFTKLFRR